MSPTCEGLTPPADFPHSGCIFEARISTLDVGSARLDIRLKWPEKNVVIWDKVVYSKLGRIGVASRFNGSVVIM